MFKTMDIFCASRRSCTTIGMTGQQNGNLDTSLATYVNGISDIEEEEGSSLEEADLERVLGAPNGTQGEWKTNRTKRGADEKEMS